ncbi:MAG TPA: ATP-grasp domain-containing protein [Bacillota bacterium]|nr:ATP-grasp domain-containing protein [Bacillota bacterium]
MFTVLFTAAGRRVELIQAFRQSYQSHNITARVISADLNPRFAPACHFADATFQVPRYDNVNYLKILFDICLKEQVNLLIPLFEPEFIILDQHREEFQQIGTLVMLSDKTVIETCKDKYLTYEFFKQHEIKCPQTWIANDLPRKLYFPLFAKQRFGMGSAGAMKVASQTKLEPVQQQTDYIVQQYVSGTEYTLDILSDFTGQVLSVVPRQRLEVRAGEVSKSRTVYRPDLIAQGKNIAEALGAIGPINIQCIDDGKDVYWIEINPRFGGGVPLSIKAGVDYPYLLYRLCHEEKVETIIGQFQDNLLMLRYDEAVFTQE